MVARIDTVGAGLPVVPPNTESVRILGVDILNMTTVDAIDLLESIIVAPLDCSRAIFIVNAHTLNLASEDHDYRDTLRSADIVFGDGTGVRWAARLRKIRMKDNLVGTDLVPELFRRSAGKNYRYFLLGADDETIERAAKYAMETYDGWSRAGHHHGYVTGTAESNALINSINATRPDMLLVGMGNPKQERWIQTHINQLQVPLVVGVGGLFDHWGGNLKRAAIAVRSMGFEWLQLLFQQPQKWRRYLLGNPRFLYRILRARKVDLEHTFRTPAE